MSSLKEIAELVQRQVSTANDESKLTVEEVEASAILEYAWQTLQMAWKEKRENGEYIIPSTLLREEELTVINGAADISELPILKALPSEMWLQNIGGIGNPCEYIKSTVNMAQLMTGDDSLPDNVRTYYVLGNKIRFPSGAHSKTVSVIYANDGSDLDADDVQCDEAIGALVRERLLQSYLGKVAPQDVTNNENPNQ